MTIFLESKMKKLSTTNAYMAIAETQVCEAFSSIKKIIRKDNLMN